MSYLNQENVFSVAGAVYDEVQKRYIVLEQTYQKQANQLQIDLETISRLENKINLELNIRQNLELELQSLKLELSDYKTNIKNIMSTANQNNEEDSTNYVLSDNITNLINLKGSVCSNSSRLNQTFSLNLSKLHFICQL